MADHLVRGIVSGRELRVSATVTTDVVLDAQRRHQLLLGSACALGSGLTTGLLLATLTKGGERVTLQIIGDGPVGSVVVDATDDGDVRGYVKHLDAGATLPAGRVQLAPLLGRNGIVNVVRDLGLRDNYQGQISLTTGELDEDVEAYLRTSEQVPSALGCEVVVDGGKIVASGGVLVQALPDGDPASVREVQHALRSGVLHDLLKAGERSARGIVEKLLSGVEFLGEPRAVRFQCRCSVDRIVDTLRLLGVTDLDEMIAEDKPAEVTCNFCNEHYLVERPTLEQIRDEIKGAPRERN